MPHPPGLGHRTGVRRPGVLWRHHTRPVDDTSSARKHVNAEIGRYVRFWKRIKTINKRRLFRGKSQLFCPFSSRRIPGSTLQTGVKKIKKKIPRVFSTSGDAQSFVVCITYPVCLHGTWHVRTHKRRRWRAASRRRVYYRRRGDNCRRSNGGPPASYAYNRV